MECTHIFGNSQAGGLSPLNGPSSISTCSLDLPLSQLGVATHSCPLPCKMVSNQYRIPCHPLSGMLPHLCIFLCFSLSFLLQPTLFYHNQLQSQLFLFFIPYHMLVHAIFSPLDKFLPFIILGHAVDHLTAMCQPHDFVVTDHDCSQPIVALVGFHICPLLETKHGLCTVHFHI
jgi:hypothetical protein